VFAVSQLAGKVAIITGASSGIGQAAARLFAAEGARVVVSARREPALKALVEEIERAGGTAVPVCGDVRDEQTAHKLVATATERYGGLDIAFNNAGALGAVRAIPDLPAASWREVLDVNLTSAFLAAKHQIPALLGRGGGSLIFTSTFVGYTVGFPGLGAYAAAKAGLLGLMKVIAAEFGPKNIRANALLPGGTDTPMGRAVASTPEARAFIENLHAVKRLARPEEIAAAALFLAADASSFMTGSCLLVDGGVSVTRT
jgi:NAD(P)-dependent dehydrogenase (short-subunit alcohol dehydrogenase family)